MLVQDYKFVNKIHIKDKCFDTASIIISISADKVHLYYKKRNSTYCNCSKHHCKRSNPLHLIQIDLGTFCIVLVLFIFMNKKDFYNREIKFSDKHIFKLRISTECSIA